MAVVRRFAVELEETDVMVFLAANSFVTSWMVAEICR